MDTIDPWGLVLFDEVQDRTAALAGAFAENVALGSRGAQIRTLGESLGTMIEALRLKLTEPGGQLQISGMLSDLEQLRRMVEAARTYGVDENG